MTRQRTGFVAPLVADVTTALGNRIALVAFIGDPAKLRLAAASLASSVLSGVLAAPVAGRIGPGSPRSGRTCAAPRPWP